MTDGGSIMEKIPKEVLAYGDSKSLQDYLNQNPKLDSMEKKELTARLKLAEKIEQKEANKQKHLLDTPKVYRDGKVVDHVSMDDITDQDRIMLDGVKNISERQTTGNGCWSVALQIQLKYRGAAFTQEEIRRYRPHCNNPDSSEVSNLMARLNGDYMNEMYDVADLVQSVLPDTAHHHVLISSEQENREKSKKAFKEIVQTALLKDNSPISLLYGKHYITIMGIQGETLFVCDSLENQEKNPVRYSLDEVMEIARNNGRPNIAVDWMEDMQYTKDYHCEAIENEWKDVGITRVDGVLQTTDEKVNSAASLTKGVELEKMDRFEEGIYEYIYLPKMSYQLEKTRKEEMNQDHDKQLQEPSFEKISPREDREKKLQDGLLSKEQQTEGYEQTVLFDKKMEEEKKRARSAIKDAESMFVRGSDQFRNMKKSFEELDRLGKLTQNTKNGQSSAYQRDLMNRSLRDLIEKGQEYLKTKTRPGKSSLERRRIQTADLLVGFAESQLKELETIENLYKATNSDIDSMGYNRENNQKDIGKHLDAQRYDARYDPKKQTLTLEKIEPLYETAFSNTERYLKNLRTTIKDYFEQVEDEKNFTEKRVQEMFLKATVYELVRGERSLHIKGKGPGPLEQALIDPGIGHMENHIKELPEFKEFMTAAKNPRTGELDQKLVIGLMTNNQPGKLAFKLQQKAMEQKRKTVHRSQKTNSDVHTQKRQAETIKK